MKINESYTSLRAMISRFLYQIPSDIGSKGGVEGELVHLSDVLGYDMSDIQPVLDGNWDPNLGQKANNQRIMEKYFPEIYRIWDNYRKAMTRRRPGDELGIYSFSSVALGRRHAFVYGKSVVLGRYSNGYFKPSHFCPDNMREGVEMLRALSMYDNIIFAVTEDLGPMLLKLGLYGNEKTRIPMFFRNRMVEKQIYTTDKELLAKIINNMSHSDLMSLASEYNYGDARDKIRMNRRYADIGIGSNSDKMKVPMGHPYGRNRKWASESIVRRVVNEAVGEAIRGLV